MRVELQKPNPCQNIILFLAVLSNAALSHALQKAKCCLKTIARVISVAVYTEDCIYVHV